MFNPINFRRLTGEEPLTKVRSNQKISLVLVKPNGDIRFARMVSDKDKLMEIIKDEDLIIMNWMGEYRSDMFILNKDELKRIY